MGKLYVLDTSVLIHDPDSPKRFEDNTVAIPIFAVMELDHLKTGNRPEVSMAARTVSRFINDLMNYGDLHDPAGVKHPEHDSVFRVVANGGGQGLGALEEAENTLKMDRLIISVALSLQKNHPDDEVILVSKDVNMRILSNYEGLQAEDYRTDRIVWEHSESHRVIENAEIDLHAAYGDEGVAVDSVGLGDMHENEFVVFENGEKQQVFRCVDRELSPVEKEYPLTGIHPRNLEQRMALDILTDPDVQLITLVGKAGTGKAQPTYSKVLTPTGWISFGEVSVGTEICTPDGGSSKVTGVFPQGKKDVFRVWFTDGSFADSCKEHLWYTQTTLERDQNKPGRVRSLGEIMTSLRYGSQQKRNHSIPMTLPVQMRTADQPLDPYLLGLLLGDGCFRGNSPSLSTADGEILEYVKDALSPLGVEVSYRSGYDYALVGPRTGGVERNPLTENLQRLGLWGLKSDAKFIPQSYLIADEDQRLSLLQGLMDSDGTVDSRGYVSFTTTSERLLEGVKALIQSFGGTAKSKNRRTSYTHKGVRKEGKTSHRVTVNLPNGMVPFKLSRKQERVVDRKRYHPRRYIDRVELVGSHECVCIMVDHPDHLYLTDNFVVTHNTFLALAAAIGMLDNTYDRVLLSKPVVPMGKDIGYLPGDFDSKMEPWMKSFFDNLDQLITPTYRARAKGGQEVERGWEYLFDTGQMEIQALHSIRGRSIPNAFMIIDEAQNLTPHEVKTIITRAAEGTKIVLCGDPYQIDQQFLDQHSNGLVYVTERTKGYAESASVTFTKGERSRLAELAATAL